MWGFVDEVKSISAFMTETLALKRALMIAIDLSLNKVCFESDCQFLIDSVNNQLPDLHVWKSRSIVQEIINLLASNVGFSISFAPRIHNAFKKIEASFLIKKNHHLT